MNSIIDYVVLLYIKVWIWDINNANCCPSIVDEPFSLLRTCIYEDPLLWGKWKMKNSSVLYLSCSKTIEHIQHTTHEVKLKIQIFSYKNVVCSRQHLLLHQFINLATVCLLNRWTLNWSNVWAKPFVHMFEYELYSLSQNRYMFPRSFYTVL